MLLMKGIGHRVMMKGIRHMMMLNGVGHRMMMNAILFSISVLITGILGSITQRNVGPMSSARIYYSAIQLSVNKPLTARRKPSIDF
jgi:hypothetical protein